MLDPYSSSVCFWAAVSPARVGCCLCGPNPVEDYVVGFVRTAKEHELITMETRRHRPNVADYRVLNPSSYLSLDEHALAHMSTPALSLVEGGGPETIT